METVSDFILGGYKITADSDCSHEIQRHLLLGRKAMNNLDSILKSRDIANKDLSSQSYGFSIALYMTFHSHVQMWELDCKESWAPKNWCFWTVVLEKNLESPWAARRSILSILKEISPKYSLEGLMLRMKLQYFSHLMGRTGPFERPWCWERLKAGGEGGDRGWDGWMASLTQYTWVWASFVFGDGQGSLVCCSPWAPKELDMTEQLNDWCPIVLSVL